MLNFSDFEFPTLDLANTLLRLDYRHGGPDILTDHGAFELSSPPRSECEL